MSNETIYPSIPNGKVVMSEEETRKIFNEKLDEKLNESRIKYMLNERDSLNKDLKHYRKIHRRYKKLDLGFKISSGILIGITGITAALVSGPFIVPVLPVVLGALSAVESAIFTGLFKGLTSRKKKKFNDKCKLIQGYLDRIYYYVEHAGNDSVLTLDELKGFEKLLN